MIVESVIFIVRSILSILVGKAAEYTVDLITQQLSYLFNHKSKFQSLRGRLQELNCARERVVKDVDEADRKGEAISDPVKLWLIEVNEKISEEAAAQLEEDEEKGNQSCFFGLCPNFKSRYQLSRKAEKEANTIAELLEQKDRFERVSDRPPPEGIATRSVKEFVDFNSRTGAFDAVMEALKNANLSIIGIYGMGGVGKTTLVKQVATLVKQVARQAKEKILFDEVVVAAVTQSFGINKIQDQIADELGLKFQMQSEDGRAGELRNRLKKSRNILVILDDIWVELDMEALGIPYGDEHPGCKILLTSRNNNVLSQMGSQKGLPIDVLEEEEAWNLFRKMASDIVLKTDLKSTAIDICKECAGLPIAIVTVGKAMRNKEKVEEWEDALLQLRRPSERNFDGISATAYSAIETSYKFLRVKEHQLTFLLCSIMDRDAAIEDLFKYGMGLGLFSGVSTIKEARNRASTLVSNLKRTSLLLDGSTSEHFDMHDVVRDVAISIASRDHHWLALGRDYFALDEETMRNYKLMTIHNAKVSEFLHYHQLECPNLNFFSLGSKDSSVFFKKNLAFFSLECQNFFEGMPRLKVLNFACMHFSSIPSSFRFLKNIRTLCFSWCDIKDIAIIGELQNLEILSLCASEIEVLPWEIGNLTKLKLLDLSNCRRLKVISPNVLSRLSRLEELYLYDSFDKWEVEGHEKPIANASLVELQHLSHLTTLEIHIPNEKALAKELFSEKLERYKVSIGKELPWPQSPWHWNLDWKEISETKRSLQLNLNKSIHWYDVGIKKILRKTETLFLNAVRDGMDVLYDPNTEGLSHLKHLRVSNDSEVKYIVRLIKLISREVFSLLESLIIEKLMNLEAICYGQRKAKCFGQLTIIVVDQCHMLKILFPFTIARELGSLQKIVVSNCKNFTGLIVERREEEIGGDDILEFSQLRCLRLSYLPSFKGVFYLEKNLSSSQQEGSIESTVTTLFDQKVVFPHIEELHLSELTSVEKIWHDEHPVMPFVVESLKTLSVVRCNNLKNLFTSSMVKCFVQLKKLYVRFCEKMEEVIIVSEEGNLVEEEKMMKIVFPKLQELTLWNLPNLKRFCGGNPIEFPSLKNLSIMGCPSFEEFHCESTSVGTIAGSSNNISMDNLDATHVPKYPFNRKVVFPHIEELHLSELTSVEKICHDELPVMPFVVQSLTTLSVVRCDNLKNLFTSSRVKCFAQLKKFDVGFCKKMEVIIASEEGNLVEEEKMMKIVFPKLQDLKLRNLRNLKRFCCYGNPIEFPSLKNLSIMCCPSYEEFHCESTSVGTIAGSSNNISMDNLRATHVPKYLFNRKVALPMLEELVIDGLKNMGRLWPNQLADDQHSFSKLIDFELSRCHKILNVFPLSMLTTLQSLNKLIIEECYSLEEIFESQQQEEEEGSSAVVQENNITFEFPQVTFLSLRDLPNLKSFSRKKLATNWPSLKEMSVSGCYKIEIFASEYMRNYQQDISIHRPLFWINELTFPNLQKLELGLNDGMREIFHGKSLASHYFCNLKDVYLYWYSTDLIPSYLLQLLSLPNLQSLEIKECDFKELVFQSEGVGGDEKSACAWMLLSQLTELRLVDLRKLMHLWKEKEGLENLRILKLNGCPKLKGYLIPSSGCFQNLATCEVKECHRIIKLVTHSTAKSLVQLREMRISDCRKLEEIIEGSDDDHGEVKDEISFPRLNLLILVKLPKLESFCSSGNHTFGFPSLATVFVEVCPKMKIFAQGGLNAPMLHNLRTYLYREYKWVWEGSLNNTIQQLFKERSLADQKDDDDDDDESDDDGGVGDYSDAATKMNPIEEEKNAMEDQDIPSTSNIQ